MNRGMTFNIIGPTAVPYCGGSWIFMIVHIMQCDAARIQTIIDSVLLTETPTATIGFLAAADDNHAGLGRRRALTSLGATARLAPATTIICAARGVLHVLV